MVMPINVLEKSMNQKITLLLKDNRILEGRLIGFDEYMNLVLDGADEVSAKRGTRKPLGRILLKGDTVTLMRPVVSSGGGGGGG